jgi:hypothetical protein
MRVHSWFADMVSDRSDACRNQYIEDRPIDHFAHCATCCTASSQSASLSGTNSRPLQGLVPPPAGNGLMSFRPRLSAKDTEVLL